jgi:hypothetical protein
MPIKADGDAALTGDVPTGWRVGTASVESTLTAIVVCVSP